MKVTDCIDCPKCRKPFMKASAHPELGKEYFCHKCHEYFGVNELVNTWNYDSGDLFPAYPVTFGNYKNWYRNFPTQKKFFCEYVEGEPMWNSMGERDDAYQMVSRMFQGIKEIDDYGDLLATYAGALGVSIQ